MASSRKNSTSSHRGTTNRNARIRSSVVAEGSVQTATVGRDGFTAEITTNSRGTQFRISRSSRQSMNGREARTVLRVLQQHYQTLSQLE